MAESMWARHEVHYRGVPNVISVSPLTSWLTCESLDCLLPAGLGCQLNINEIEVGQTISTLIGVVSMHVVYIMSIGSRIYFIHDI